MKIKALQQLELEISEQEHKHVALEYLYKAFDWKSEYFIEDEKVCQKKTYHSSHSWEGVEKIRDATEQDYFVAGVIKMIAEINH
jgi:hypothetical protein